MHDRQKQASKGEFHWQIGAFSFWDKMVKVGQNGARGQNGSSGSNWYLDGS